MQKLVDREVLLTLITVVYNGKNTISNTIKCAVECKQLNEVEYIVIDGGSTDGTIDLIKAHEPYIDYWISERDYGIYDAMNKGAKIAKGEYVYFLNSGDIIYNSAVEKLIEELKVHKLDVFYGNVLNFTTNLLQKGKSIQTMAIEMPFCHQAAVVKTKLMKETPFDINIKIAADYDFFRKLYVKGCSFKYIDLVVGEIDGEGVSNTLFKKTIAEYIKIHWNNNQRLKAFLAVFKYINYKRRFIAYVFLKSWWAK